MKKTWIARIAAIALALGVGGGAAAAIAYSPILNDALETRADSASFAPSDFSGQGTSGTGSAISATKNGITVSNNKGFGTTQIRMYKDSVLTISAGSGTITDIEFTLSGSYTGGLSTSYSGLSTSTWEKTLTSQARITALTVTYTPAATTAKLTGISLSGDYPTAFTVGDPFSHEGMTVTASYDNGSSADVTADATFSGYDMSTAGDQTVTVSYTESDVTKTATYDINVAAPKTLDSVTISGTATAELDGAWDLSGLAVLGEDTDGESMGDITEDCVLTSEDVASPVGSKTITVHVNYKDGKKEFDVNGVAATVAPAYVKDVLDRDFIGITSTNYDDWSGKVATSGAVYAGNSAGGNESIQLRTTNSKEGLVTTSSGGTAKKIEVVWNSNTSDGRKIDIYGKNTAYAAATDLYASASQGTKIGTLSKGETVLEISDEYKFIGIRSYSGALYLTQITISWEQIELTSIEVSGQKTAFTVDDSFTFDGTVTAYYSNNTHETVSEGYTCTFKDSGAVPGVLAIDDDGKTIVVAYEDKTAEYDISVDWADPTQINITPTKDVEMGMNDSATITASVDPSATAEQKVEWILQAEGTTLTEGVNEGFTYVYTDTTLTVTSYEETGTVRFLVKATGPAASESEYVTFTVIGDPTVELSESSISAWLGDDMAELTAEVKNLSGTITYTWSTEDKGVIEIVDDDGLCYVDFKAVGTETITLVVSNGTVTLDPVSCVVTVAQDYVTNLQLTGFEASDVVGYYGDDLTSDIVDDWKLTATWASGKADAKQYSFGEFTMETENGSIDALPYAWQEGDDTITLRFDAETVVIDTDLTVRLDRVMKSVPGVGQYEKVTSADEFAAGTYLIVYEDSELSFDGSLSALDAVGNGFEAAINEGKITSSAAVDARTFTIASDGNGNYTIRSASGYYIGQTGDSNGLQSSETTAYTNSISFDNDGNADIVSSGGAHLRYNSASNQVRFRYYKSTSYTGQKAIALYRYVDGEPVETDIANTYHNAQKAVVEFAQYFNGQMSGANVCGSGEAAGKSVDPTSAEFIAAWSNCATKYSQTIGVLEGSDLDHAMDLIKYAEAKWSDNESLHCLERAMATYEWVVTHYASAEITPFLSDVRNVQTANVLGIKAADATNSIVLVAAILGVGALAATGLVFLGKRRRAE